MKDFAIQFIIPILSLVGWFTIATIAASVLGHKTQIESWCLARPKLALLIQLCRRTGIDVWGLIGAFRQYAANKAALNGGVIVESPKKSTAIRATLNSLVCLLLISGCAALTPTPSMPCSGLYCLEWSGSVVGLPGKALICAETEVQARQAAKALLEQDPKSTVRKVSR